MFITGSRRWTDMPGWPPPARATAWYLQPAGQLGVHPPAPGPPSWFRCDATDPTPSIAGTAVGLSGGPADNRRLEARPDVLTFSSGPQAADIEVIGPVRVRLHVQASVPYGRSTSPTGSSVLRMPHRTRPIPSSLIYGPFRTRSGAGTGSGCRSPVVSIPATGATTTPQNRSPPAHGCRPATAQCSTMPSTPPHCGDPYTTTLCEAKASI